MDESLDKVWRALADPTRREILDLLRDAPRRTTEVVVAFPQLSRFGVMKHLDVLKECELVVAKKQGREVYNALNVIPLRRIYERWVRKFEDLWADRLLRVKELAEGGLPSS